MLRALSCFRFLIGNYSERLHQRPEEWVLDKTEPRGIEARSDVTRPNHQFVKPRGIHWSAQVLAAHFIASRAVRWLHGAMALPKKEQIDR
jgi:hypothetical protein